VVERPVLGSPTAELWEEGIIGAAEVSGQDTADAIIAVIRSFYLVRI